MNFSLEVKVLKVAGHFVAVAQPGGLTIRGRPADSAELAVRNLFFVLAGQSQNDDAALGVALLVEGTTLDAQLALGDGGD